MANYGGPQTHARRLAVVSVVEDHGPTGVSCGDVLRALQAQPEFETAYGAIVHQDLRRLETLGVLARPTVGMWAATGATLTYVEGRYQVGDRPAPAQEPGAPGKTCPICRRRFQAEGWTCGDTVCAELLPPARELLDSLSGLESRGLRVLLDVDIRRGQRFVEVRTGRGVIRTNCWKYEPWDEAVGRAVA